MEKQCKTCRNFLSLENFYKCKKSKDGLDYVCKPCTKARVTKWNKDNKDRYNENMKRAIKNRKDTYTDQRLYSDNEKQCTRCNVSKDLSSFYYSESRKGYYSLCKDCVSSSRKARRETINSAKRERRKQPHVRVRENLTARLSQIVKTNNYGAKVSITKALDCTLAFFLDWIAFQFDSNMTFENYGQYWHIDHCIPCSKFDLSKKEDQLRCFHWTNLRPMEKISNIKRSNNVTDREILLQDIKSTVFKKSYSP